MKIGSLVILGFGLMIGRLCQSQGQDPDGMTMSGVNHPDPLGVPIVGPGDISASETINLFSGSVGTSVPLLPMVMLAYGSSNMPSLMSLENRDMQASWVGAGWSLQMSRIMADPHGTKDLNDDDWFYVDASGASSKILKDASGILRIQGNLSWKVNFSFSTGGDLVTGVTITKDDGSKYKYGDFQVGYGSKNANRCIFYWGNRVADLSTAAGSGLICYSWDLSQVIDPYGTQLADVYYTQEQVGVTMSDGTQYYTRASYVDYIQNLRTGQKIDFVNGTRDADEYQDAETASSKIEMYETQFLSLVKVFPTASSLTPIMRDSLGYDLITSNGSTKTKRLLRSITQFASNDVAYPSINFTYDPAKDYILSSIQNPTGGAGQITSQYTSFQYSLLEPQLSTDYTLISGTTGLTDASNFVAASTGTLVAQYDVNTRTINVKKWIGQWNSQSISIDDALVGPYADISLRVSDNHIALVYPRSSVEVSVRIYDWDDVTQTWSLGKQHNFSNRNQIALAMSLPSGSHVAVYVANYSDQPLTTTFYSDHQSWHWQPKERTWEDLGGYSNAIYQDGYSPWWPLQSFEVTESMLCYDGPGGPEQGNGFFLKQWLRTPTGIQWYTLLNNPGDGTHPADRTYYALRDNYLGCYFAPEYTGFLQAFNFVHNTSSGLATPVEQLLVSSLTIRDWANHPSYPIFANDRILFCEFTSPQSFSDQGVNVRVWKRNDNVFALAHSSTQPLWSRFGPDWTGESGWDSPRNWHVTCQVTDDWVFVFQHRASRSVNNPFEGHVYGYKYNIASGQYTGDDVPYVYPHTSGSEYYWKVFYKSTMLLTDKYLVINAPGRASAVDGFAVRNGFTDVFKLDRTDPAGWRTSTQRIFVSNAHYSTNTSYIERQILAGYNFVGVHLAKSGETKARFFHGKEQTWDNNVLAYVATGTSSLDGMGNTISTSYTYSTPTFDPFLTTPGFSIANATIPLNGYSKTTYNNSLSQPLLKGAVSQSQHFAEGSSTEVQQSSSSFTTYQDPTKPYIFQVRKSSDTKILDGVTTSVLYEYNDINGAVKKSTSQVSALSDLSGIRDVVKEIRFAYEDNTTMASANMLTQPGQQTTTAIRDAQDHVWVDASLTVNLDQEQFTVAFSQTVSWNAEISDGHFYVGTTFGGSDIVNRSANGFFSGSFQADPGVTYYVEAQRVPPDGGVYGEVLFYAGPDPISVIVSKSDVVYGSNGYPLQTRVWDGSQWVTASIVINRDGYGNILESENVDNIHTVTKWGYNSTLPVATFVNATSASSLYEDFEEGRANWGNNNWSGGIASFQDVSTDISYTSKTAFKIVKTGPAGAVSIYTIPYLAVEGGKDYLASLMIRGKDNTPNRVYVQMRFFDATYAQVGDALSPVNESTFAWRSHQLRATAPPQAIYMRLWLINESTEQVSTIWFDNLRIHPTEAFCTSQSFDPATFQALSKTDENYTSGHTVFDGFGNILLTQDHEKRTLSQQVNYLSRQGHTDFEPTDPNYSSSITYTSQDGYSDFSFGTGWTHSGDVTFNQDNFGQTCARIADAFPTTWLSKDAGPANLVSRVDFQVASINFGSCDVLMFASDGGAWKFSLQISRNSTGQLWPNFRIATVRSGGAPEYHDFALSAVGSHWYTIEIEKTTVGECFAWVYPREEGRNTLHRFGLSGFPVDWNATVGSAASASAVYYLANHYVGIYSQTKTFTDGLGRTIQTQTRDGDSSIVSAVVYDAASRQSKTYFPFKAYGHTYEPDYATHASQRYYPSPNIINPYAEAEYFNDPLGRVHFTKPIGSNSSDEYAEAQHGSASLDGQLSSFTDAIQRPGLGMPRMHARQFMDKLGRVVKTSVLENGTTEVQSSTTLYNMLGKPVRIIDPNGFVDTMTYDFLGRLKTERNVDAGTSRYIYDKAGRLRFMIDSAGISANPDNILYWKYDIHGRVTEKGYIVGTWNESTLQADAQNPSLPTSPSTWRKEYSYDGDGVTLYMKGRLDTVITNNDDDDLAEVVETFVYDKYGRVLTKTQKVVDYNTDTYATGYEYDHLGRVTKVFYPTKEDNLTLQNQTLTGVHGFEVTGALIAENVSISPGALVNFQAGTTIMLKPGFTAANGSQFSARITGQAEPPFVVTYAYNQLGQVSSVGALGEADNFASYTYKPDGRIAAETINNGGSTKEYLYRHRRGYLTRTSSTAFSDSLSYDGDGFQGAAYYNGMIASTSYEYGPGGPGNYSYRFKYDNLGRIIAADNSINNAVSYGVSQPMTYDANGNMLTKPVGGNPIPLAYSYFPGTNKVQSYAGSEYQYDPNANITSSASKALSSIEYDPFTQLTLRVSETGQNEHVSFEYDGSKERVLKTEQIGMSPVPNATLYIRGMSEYPLTVKYNEHGSISDKLHVYGPTGLLAMRDGGSWFFALKDHLGSMRVALNANNQAVTWYDYSPFGDVWRSTVNKDVAYQFTGQEFDIETGLHNFRARLYDSDLGRFYAMDPSKQGFSPFAYAGNSPTMYVDKDGRIWFIPLIIGFATGYLSHGIATHDWGWGAIGSGSIGAASSFVGWGITSEISPFFKTTLGFSQGLSTVAAGGLSGGITGAIFAPIAGGDIGTNFLSGFLGGAIGGAAQLGLSGINPDLKFGLGIVAGGIVGGTTSAAFGGDFWRGFAGGAMGAAMSGVAGEIVSEIYNGQLSLEEAMEILGITDQEWEGLQYSLEDGKSDYFSMEYGENGNKEVWAKLQALYARMNPSATSHQLGNFELGKDVLRFGGELHVRYVNGQVSFHRDLISIVRNPLGHLNDHHRKEVFKPRR